MMKSIPILNAKLMKLAIQLFSISIYIPHGLPVVNFKERLVIAKGFNQ